jgi:predicted DNA-binding transcriptional regulator YafY
MSTRPQPDVMRMLTLVPWLIERPGASLAETADAFATDVATVRAELEHLDFCGLPGLGGGALFDVTIIGDHVTVRMADELRYPMRPTPHEALRLLLIATAADRVVGGEVPALRSAIAKLHHALGVAEGAVAVLDEPDDVVQLAREAIADGVRVRFEYRGRGDREPTLRTVEPWAVELSEGAWYLHGLDVDAGAGRVFRLDRAADLRSTADPALSEAPALLERPAYVPQEDDLDVELMLEPPSLWLLDAVSADATEVGADGRTRVRLRTGSPEWLTRLLLMTGGGAEVIRPDELRERVRSRAQEALARLA